MILFYVVFGKLQDISGVMVAIIGFTLTFGAFVYDHMCVSVDSVNKGQTEAAYSLGYNKRQTFYRIIFPLITTAVIYFIVTWILALLLKRIKLRFEPRTRSDEEVLREIKK